MEMQLTKIFPILTGSDCVIIQQVLRNQTLKTSPYTPYAERKETGGDQLENEASWAW